VLVKTAGGETEDEDMDNWLNDGIGGTVSRTYWVMRMTRTSHASFSVHVISEQCVGDQVCKSFPVFHLQLMSHVLHWTLGPLPCDLLADR
jgi:hypothetical protein